MREALKRFATVFCGCLVLALVAVAIVSAEVWFLMTVGNTYGPVVAVGSGIVIVAACAGAIYAIVGSSPNKEKVK